MDQAKVLIIDDERLARYIIKKLLGKRSDVEVIGECTNGFEGIKRITEQEPDIIFLDIQMPKITGFEMLELLDNDHPEIIFTTAFDQFAIKAFEVNATDYLLKPFTNQRFNEALDKAIKKVKNRNKSDTVIENLLKSAGENIENLNRIVVKTNNKIIIIPADKIRYIEAQDDYVMIHSELGKHMKKQTMKFYEEHLDGNNFFRVHRSYLVNLSKIKQLELFEKDSYKIKMNDGNLIPVSRSGYGKIKEIFK
jgi:two-component system LytT family response regulator